MYEIYRQTRHRPLENTILLVFDFSSYTRNHKNISEIIDNDNVSSYITLLIIPYWRLPLMVYLSTYIPGSSSVKRSTIPSPLCLISVAIADTTCAP